MLVRAGRLVDGVSSSVKERIRIEIERGVITAIVRDEGQVPASSAELLVVDATAATVLPGLIDTHVVLEEGSLSSAVDRLRALAARGVTTAALTGLTLDDAIGLRRYIGTARHRGPRLLVSGPMIELDAGADPAATAALARARAVAGVDFLAVRLDTGFGARPGAEEALCALTAEAHLQKLRVLAEAETEEAAKIARACKVDHLHEERGAIPPAATLGLQDALGRLEVGFRADLLVVRGRPERGTVTRVFIDGIEQKSRAPSFWSYLAAELHALWAALKGG